MSKGFALVIEDDFDASTIFGKAMEANDLDYEVITNGRQGLERLATAAPDIVILDLHLPDVDGAQILNRIRGDERLKETLVVIVSADARMADMLNADADLVLLKPAPYSQVRDFAARLLMRRRKPASPATPPPASSPEVAAPASPPEVAVPASPPEVAAPSLPPVPPPPVARAGDDERSEAA